MNKFCVIGALPGGWKRTWCDDMDMAIAHAGKLVRDNYAKTGKPDKLLVVEVKQVIEIGMPPVNTRAPSDEDFPTKEAIVEEDEVEGSTGPNDQGYRGGKARKINTLIGR